MKEATGEVSMTVITLVAIAVIGAIIAMMWPSIKGKVTSLWNTSGTTQDACIQAGGVWDTSAKICKEP